MNDEEVESEQFIEESEELEADVSNSIHHE
jgi:hypothetical protein